MSWRRPAARELREPGGNHKAPAHRQVKQFRIAAIDAETPSNSEAPGCSPLIAASFRPGPLPAPAEFCGALRFCDLRFTYARLRSCQSISGRFYIGAPRGEQVAAISLQKRGTGIGAHWNNSDG